MRNGKDPTAALPVCPEPDEDEDASKWVAYPLPGATCRREDALA